MSIEFNKDVSGIKPGSNDEKKIIIVKPQADPAQIGKLLGQKTGKLVKEVSQEELLKHLQELIERQTQQAPEYEPSAVRVLPNEPPAKRILPYEPWDGKPPAKEILPYEPWDGKPPAVIAGGKPTAEDILPNWVSSEDLQELIERQTQQAPEYKLPVEKILSYGMSPEEWKKLQEKIEELLTSWERKQQEFKSV